MLRKIVRSYYKLRYLPRHVFALLNEINSNVERLGAEPGQLVLRGSTPNDAIWLEIASLRRAFDDMREDMSSFCSDMTRELLALEQAIGAAATRVDGAARIGRRSEDMLLRIVEQAAKGDAHAASGFEARVQRMEAVLSNLTARIDRPPPAPADLRETERL